VLLIGSNVCIVTQQLQIGLQPQGRLEELLLSSLDGRLRLQVTLQPAGVLLLTQSLAYTQTHRETKKTHIYICTSTRAKGCEYETSRVDEQGFCPTMTP